MAKRPGVVVVCGNGIGKTNAAIGKGIKALAEEKTVTLIQFLKGKANQELMKVLKRLEPEMKAFSFEKYEGLFENLPENLRDTAIARLEYPDASIQELGGYLDPPVGKSGVNHRLRKLKQIADEL